MRCNPIDSRHAQALCRGASGSEVQSSREVRSNGEGKPSRALMVAIPVLILSAVLNISCISTTQATAQPTTEAKAAVVKENGTHRGAATIPNTTMAQHENRVIGLPTYDLTVRNPYHYGPQNSDRSPLFSLSGRPDYALYQLDEPHSSVRPG